MIDLRTLPRDCDCVTHEFPHWLHEDKWTFEQNLRLLQQPRGALAGLAFSENEHTRLSNKRFSMRRYTHDETEEFIFPDGYRERDYQARVREALADIIPQEQA